MPAYEISDMYLYSEYAILINQLHDLESRPEDITRTTIVQNLELKSWEYESASFVIEKNIAVTVTVYVFYGKWGT